MRILIKGFLFFGIIVSLPVIASYLIRNHFYGYEYDLVSKIYIWSLLALFVSIIGWVAQIIYVLRLPFGNFKNAMILHHNREFLLNSSIDESFLLCLNSLSQFRVYAVLNEDKVKGEIISAINCSNEYRAPSHCLLTMNIEKKNKKETMIKISSKPKWFCIPCDFGANLKIVEKIESYLKDNADLEESSLASRPD